MLTAAAALLYLVCMCVYYRQLQQALQLFKSMRGDGVKPDIITYNTLIDAAAKVSISNHPVHRRLLMLKTLYFSA
jgi:pentatricopeptide repeat protein